MIDTGLAKLKPYLDLDAPVVTKLTWVKLQSEGWRWEVNLNVWHYDKDVQQIRAAQSKYGKANVALGHPFDENVKREPALKPSFCGLYVNDVDKQVRDFATELDNPNAKIWQWLKGKI